MSLMKLLKIPSRLFKKDVITFLIIRRYDFGVLDKKLHYIAVRPNASISQLRQKIWHLLDLPDYCEELIILKSEDEKELPLTELRKGNDPQHPYILEVYYPRNNKLYNNMITMGDNKIKKDNSSFSGSLYESKMNREFDEKTTDENSAYTKTANETALRNKMITSQNSDLKWAANNMKSELTCKMSSSSIFFKIHGRKSRDNFANILLKIQSDLTTLNNKLSDLENRIQV